MTNFPATVLPSTKELAGCGLLDHKTRQETTKYLEKIVLVGPMLKKATKLHW